LEERPYPERVEAVRWRSAPPRLSTGLDYFRWHRYLRLLLRTLDPALVVAGPVQTAAFLAAMSTAVKLVAISWGSDILVDAGSNAWMRAISRFTLRRAAGAIADCDAVRREMVRLAPPLASRIAVLPWGIDVQQFRPSSEPSGIRRRLGWDANTVWISTRSWEPRYHINVLLHAFAALRRAHPEVRLLLLGDGSLAEQVQHLLTSLDLGDHVHAPGRVPEDTLVDFFRAADVYVSTSASDGTSVSLLQAMGCGLPPIVSAGYGNLEWVRPGVNGWLAPPGDMNALVTAMTTAMRQASRWPAIRASNVALVRSRADWSRNVARVLQLFDDLVPAVHGRPPSPPACGRA
jgi:glycosyltransferase involved in cell wall biosynthesis